MRTIEYTTIDKSEWGYGSWNEEPDKIQYQGAHYPCLIHRGPSGALCGYVGVPPSHSCYGTNADDALLESLSVHGCITYADSCQKSDCESRGICHVPDSGESGEVWWLGFDCSHLFDLTPAYSSTMGGGVYRDILYVKAEIEKLESQINTLA